MKKSVKTTLAVALVLLITGLGLLAWSASAHGGLRGLWDGAAVNLNWVSSGSGDLRGYTVCQSGEESFDPAAVKRLDLGWVAGSVKLQPGGAEITVKERCSEPLREDQKLCWKLENGTLSLRFCSALHTAMPGKELELSFPATAPCARRTAAATRLTRARPAGISGSSAARRRRSRSAAPAAACAARASPRAAA